MRSNWSANDHQAISTTSKSISGCVGLAGLPKGLEFASTAHDNIPISLLTPPYLSRLRRHFHAFGDISTPSATSYFRQHFHAFGDMFHAFGDIFTPSATFVSPSATFSRVHPGSSGITPARGSTRGHPGSPSVIFSTFQNGL